MAFTITYKRLFELRLLPGHALDAADGTAFADRVAADQANALSQFNLGDLFDIRPDAETQRVMAGLKMKHHVTGQSMLVGVSVNEEDNGGNPAYRPIVPPVNGTRFRFIISAKNPQLGNLINLPWRPAFPAKLWLSNSLVANYPSLAVDVPAYAAGSDYEMGDLVSQAANVYEALQDVLNAAVTPGTDPAIWSQINDHQYANRNDLRLVGNRISYRLPSGSNEIDVSWELVETGPTTIASGNPTSPSRLSQINIDFADSPAGAYTLNLTGTNGFTASHAIQLEPSYSENGILGVVEILHDAGLGTSRLMENSGILRTEANITTTPVFDIPLRRRSAFFRYIFTPDLAPATPLGDLQAEVDNRYITQNPMPLLKARVSVSYDGGTILPNPNVELLKNESNRVFAEIFVYT